MTEFEAGYICPAAFVPRDTDAPTKEAIAELERLIRGLEQVIAGQRLRILGNMAFIAQQKQTIAAFEHRKKEPL